MFIGGYSGEVVTTARAQVAFAPDRGLTKAFLGRARYTIDTNRSVSLEGAVRQNGDGTWLRFEVLAGVGPAPPVHRPRHPDCRRARRLLRPLRPQLARHRRSSCG